ncbi:hypothetical protein BGZ96_004346 [Linnemannia gamsii]|uniref:Uncharacterized protein n=1 Tax=Linnemannia gamsii TaxID=64522 RepID=A0ABQ7K8Q2_9FUNG|nr:hypothetical protein BGZ96_004346 [Linnemannia gamsii]
MAKLYQSPPLYTNASEFIVNYIWHTPAPDRYSAKDGHLVPPTHLPDLPAAHTIRHRSVDPFPTQDHSSDYKHEHEALNGYDRHNVYFNSNPFASADVLSGPEDVRSVQITLERLRPLQDEPCSTSLTEEQKLALIEHGRAIGNRAHYYDNNNRGNIRSNTNNHYLRQRCNDTSVDMPPIRNEGVGRGYRSKITYSRDYLMTFSDFNVLPDNIDRIHWIQQNPTLDWSQKFAGPMMARLQGTFQEPRGDHQGAGTYDSKMGCHLARREGDFGGNGDADADLGLSRRHGVGKERGQGTSSESSACRGDERQRTSRGNIVFGGEGRYGTFRGDGGFRGDSSIIEERGLGAPSFPLLPSPTSTPSTPRPHVQRSSTSATGGLRPESLLDRQQRHDRAFKREASGRARLREAFSNVELEKEGESLAWIATTQYNTRFCSI